MLALLSPAKKLTLAGPLPDVPVTTPALGDAARTVLEAARREPAARWAALMDLSDDLAGLTFDRFRDLDLDAPGRPALLTFAGDVYQGARADQWPVADLVWAQDHLAILSGLYGVLRPLDGIGAYRLEMGTKLPVGGKKDLVAFWRPRIAEELARRVAGHPEESILNLASDEYFAAVDARALGKRAVVSPAFQDVKDGRARSLFLFVKRARGLLARWVVANRVERADDLRAAELDGYRWDAEASTPTRPVFRRPQPPPPGRA